MLLCPWPFCCPPGRFGRSVTEDLAGRLGLPPGEYPVAAGDPGADPELAAARSLRRVSGVRPADPPPTAGEPPGEAEEAATVELTRLLTMSLGANSIDILI